jgi:type I restriction enzyme S subunit
MTNSYRFDQIAENLTVRVEPGDTDLERYVGLEHLDPETLKIRRWGTPSDVIGQKLRFWKGDIIYGKRRAYQRKLAVADFEGICSAHTMVLRAKPDVCLPELLPFFMQSETFHQRALKISVGSLSPTINWSALARQEFFLPSLDEQRRIANLLWAADDSITEYANAIVALEKLKIAYWQEIKINGNYQLVRLKEITEIATGSTPNRGMGSYWKNGSIPWLPTQKVNEKIIHQAEEFITEKAFKECSMKLFKASSILVALYGEGKTRGSVAYLTFESCVNQAFAAIKPTEKVNGWFLYHCLDNSYIELRAFSQGSSQKNLNTQLLGQFKIPLPSIKEQETIAEMLNNFNGRISDIFAHIEVIKTVKKNLLITLLNR